MLLEAKGLWSEAEKAYTSLLEENPFDQVTILTVLREAIYMYVFIFQFLPCNVDLMAGSTEKEGCSGESTRQHCWGYRTPQQIS